MRPPSHLSGRLSCAAVATAVALSWGAPAFAQDAPSQNNAEMAAIFAADQAVRQNISPEKFHDRAFVTEMIAADAARRVQTRALLEAGALRTGDDYRAAAFVFQHGSTPEDYLLAHTLAVAATARGADGSWIAAATLDRYLQMTDKPQIYGTQTRKTRDEPATLEPYDRALIPDTLRTALAVPPQSEQDARLAAVNAAAPVDKPTSQP
ncbi:MAG: hypothetical protein ACK4MI_06815 [Brevundimonas sp.]|uniref:hypothetical protein n=1 Tax=Brevundimonas sp. TaxID=1871086 RepID=UPI0028D8D675|nr:hypothetical protein [uncultured Brevundimonas sp.]